MNAFRATKPGDSLEVLARNFGRKPDIEVTYGNCRILYYRVPWSVLSCMHRARERRAPDSVSNWSDIPFIYDSKQVLVDASGEVKAITWNGEALTVETVWGPVPGANVKVLGERMTSCCGLSAQDVDGALKGF